MMKYLLVVVMFTMVQWVQAEQQNEANREVGGLVLDSDAKKANYSLGLAIGEELKGNQFQALDPQIFIRGVLDAFYSRERQISDDEFGRIIRIYVERANKLRQQELLQQTDVQASKNLEEGLAFLASNAKKADVVSLPSGLQYRIIKKGKGSTPKLSDRVLVNYRGTLISGAEIDSTYDKEPVTFALSDVIVGWREALQLMQEGSKWRLYIPPQLAYGPGGVGNIPENSALVFEIELLAVNP